MPYILPSHQLTIQTILVLWTRFQENFSELVPDALKQWLSPSRVASTNLVKVLLQFTTSHCVRLTSMQAFQILYHLCLHVPVTCCLSLGLTIFTS